MDNDNVQVQGLEFEIISNGDEAAEKIDKLVSTVKRLKKALSGFDASPVTDALKEIKASVGAVDDQSVGKLKDTLSGVGSTAGALKTTLADLGKVPAIDVIDGETISDLSSVTGQIKEATQGFERLRSVMGHVKSAASKVGTVFKKITASISTAIQKATKTLGRAVLYSILYNAVYSALNMVTSAFREGLSNLYQYSKEFGGRFSQSMDSIATSALYLKNSLASAFAPLVEALAPVLDTLISKVASLLDLFAQFMAAMNGQTTYTKAVKSATEFAESTESAAENLKKIKTATMGFDELNIISQDTETPQVQTTPSFSSMFEEGTVGDGAKNFADKVKEGLTWVKEHLDEILITAGAIGTAFLAWKIGSGVYNALSAISSCLPALKTFSGGIGGLVKGIRDYIAGVKAMAPEVGLLAAMFPKTSAWLASVKTALSGALSGISGFFASIPATALAGIGLILAGVPTFITGLYKALTEGLDWLSGTLIAAGATATGAGIGAIVGSASGPLGIAVGALIGLAVGLVTDFTIWLVQNWDEVCAWFSGVGQKIGGFFSDCWTGIQDVWSEVSGWFNDVVIKPVTSVFQEVTDWIATFFEGCWIIVQAVWKIAKDFFKDYVSEPIRKLFEDVTSKIREVFTEAWQKVQAKWAEATAFFNNFLQPVREKFVEVGNKIKTAFTEAWQKVKSVWSEFKTFFYSTVIDPVVQRFQTAVQKIRTAFENTFTGIKNFVKGIFNGVIGQVEGVINRVISGFNGLIGKFNNVVTWAADIVGTDWRGLSTISLVSLPRLADGGFVDEGQLFIAREAGAEMVGSIGNRTSVANNDQIVEGIKAGVYEAVMAAFGSGGSNNQVVKVYLDGKEITANVEKHQRERGVSFMGGVVYG